ncbi:Pentatricopeptide repeat-containing protein, mitochondrial, partial [Mucuna pruriens]
MTYIIQPSLFLKLCYSAAKVDLILYTLLVVHTFHRFRKCTSYYGIVPRRIKLVMTKMLSLVESPFEVLRVLSEDFVMEWFKKLIVQQFLNEFPLGLIFYA